MLTLPCSDNRALGVRGYAEESRFRFPRGLGQKKNSRAMRPGCSLFAIPRYAYSNLIRVCFGNADPGVTVNTRSLPDKLSAPL